MSRLDRLRSDNDRFSRLAPHEFCVICDREGRCLVSRDGARAVCRNVESSQPAQPTGWRHAVPPDKVTPRPVTKLSKAAVERIVKVRCQAGWYADRLSDANRLAFERRYGLPPGSSKVLRLGWCDYNMKGLHYTLPVTDGRGLVLDLQERHVSGAATRMVSGSRHGITIPTGWRDYPGPVFLVVGPVNVLAVAAAGLSAVGRPSPAGGVEHLARLLRNVPPGRAVVAVGANDATAGGRWPGRAGAECTAANLTWLLGRPVAWAPAPGGHRTVHGWLTSPERGRAGWHDRGRELAAELVASATVPDLVPGTAAAGRLTLRAGDRNRWGRDRVVAELDGREVHRDRVALGDDRERRRFVRKLTALRGGIDPETVAVLLAVLARSAPAERVDDPGDTDVDTRG